MRERGDYDTAIDSYSQALEQTPWNTRIQSALAMTYADRATAQRNEGRLPSAEADLRKALELEPDDLRLQQNLATVLVERSALELDAERALEQRAEAEALSPGVTDRQPMLDAGLERRLDLAYELIERGQYDAGIERLTSLHADYPEDPQVTRLLGQSLVRQGDALAGRGHLEAASDTFDQAVALYAGAPGCEAPGWTGCPGDDVRTAHHNRIVNAINAAERDRALAALDDAEAVGLRFPDLATVLR